MQQLEQLLSEKLNLSAEQSQMAVTTVLGFLKERLPENLQGFVDSAAAGKDIDASMLDGLKDKLGGLGGMFGG